MTTDGQEPFDPQRREGVEEAGVWIRDTLGRTTSGFYHLGYSSAQPSAWSTVDDLLDDDHLEEFRLVAEGLRAHGGGKKSLVVVVTDDQAEGRARCYLAFQVARLLAEGGARVLVVDGEFEQEGPADWLGDPQREGLLDVARYGASPRAALQKSGVDRVDLMGVGSYRPHDSDPLSDEEMWSALHQLRQGWQYVLCTAPSRTRDGSFHPLLQRCDGVLMGLVLEGEARDRFEDVAEQLMDASIPIFGVMAFPRAGEASPSPAEPSAEEESAVEEEFRTRVVRSDTGPAPVEIHRSSRLFRRVVLAVAAVLLVFLGAWGAILWTQRERSAPAERPTQVAKAEQPSTPPPPLDVEHAILSGGSGPSATADAGGSAPVSAVKPQETAKRPAQVEPPQETAKPAPETVKPPQETAKPPQEAVKPPQETAKPPQEAVKPPVPSSSPEQDAERAELMKALRLRPHDGWALHPWSYRDSTRALPSVRRLRAEGMEAIVVRAEIPNRGTWFRVLVGNFATRRQALQARRILAEWPHLDPIDSVGVIKVGG